MAEREWEPGDGGLALNHARTLLEALGVEGAPCPGGDHPALAWRRAGLMAVTGRADGPGLVPPVALTAAADGALAALRAIAPNGRMPENAALLLGERARLLGLARGGAVSANRSCRLIAARGGHFALNLARVDDRELLPALFEEEGVSDWAAVERIAAGRDCQSIVARGRMLGLPIAPDETPPAPDLPFIIERLAPPRPRQGRPLVVDLSSLWAGPLAGSLLAAAGARVIKVESRGRPDGARMGHAPFYDLLNAGKTCVALDFADSADLAQLRTLVLRADIVIEASRPRALARLGLRADDAARAGTTWISITGHGRSGAAADLVGFGDDATVAGGLARAMARGWGEPLFAGDAIGDPLTGITAALIAWAGWRIGGAWLASVPLSRTIAHAGTLHEAGADELKSWQALADADPMPLTPLRVAAEPAGACGADNARLESLVAW